MLVLMNSEGKYLKAIKSWTQTDKFIPGWELDISLATLFDSINDFYDVDWGDRPPQYTMALRVEEYRRVTVLGPYVEPSKGQTSGAGDAEAEVAGYINKEGDL